MAAIPVPTNLSQLGSYYQGVAGILGNHLLAEQEPNGGEFGMDLFIGDFEDEFPRDANPESIDGSNYPTYSAEANRAADGKPYGYKRTHRPKVHELNQPPPARELGWRVLDLYPSRERKDEFFRLAGTPSELRLLLEMTRHNYEIASKYPGGWGFQHTFKEWFAEWEKGFVDLTNRHNEHGLQTNYPGSDRRNPDNTTTPGWRQDIQRRPSYSEWKDPNPEADKHYKNIEYYPNRDNPRESYPISGSDAYIIQSIQQIEWLRMLVGKDSNPLRRGVSEAKFLTGFPTLNLVFREKYPAPGKTKLESHFTISMVGFIEAEKFRKWEHEQIVDKNILKRWADRIKRVFYPNEEEERVFKLERGHEIWTYYDWKLGYDSWAPLKSENDARKLFQNLVFIKDDPFIPENLKGPKKKPYKETEFESLGETHKFVEGHRNATLYFWRAYVEMGRSGKRYTLVSRSVRSPVNIPE